ERRDARPRCVQAPAAPRGGRGTELAPRPPASPGRAPADREQWPGPDGGARPVTPAPPRATWTPPRRRDPARTGEGHPPRRPAPARTREGPASDRAHAPPGRRAPSRARPARARARPGGPPGQAAWRAPRWTGKRHGKEFRAPGGRRRP